MLLKGGSYESAGARRLASAARAAALLLIVLWPAASPRGLAQGGTMRKYHDVVLKDFDDIRHQLKDIVEGSQVTVLTFWASYCEPCLKELAELNRVSGSLREKGLSVVAINIDGPNDVIKARRYLLSHNIGVLVLYDERSKARASYEVTVIPRMFLIDRKGNILSEYRGFKDIHDIEEELVRYVH